MHCDSLEAIKVAVAGRMGVRILYKNAVAASIRKSEFRAVQLPAEMPEGKSFIVYQKSRPLSRRARAFLELLRQEKLKSP